MHFNTVFDGTMHHLSLKERIVLISKKRNKGTVLLNVYECLFCIITKRENVSILEGRLLSSKALLLVRGSHSNVILCSDIFKCIDVLLCAL